MTNEDHTCRSEISATSSKEMPANWVKNRGLRRKCSVAVHDCLHLGGALCPPSFPPTFVAQPPHCRVALPPHLQHNCSILPQKMAGTYESAARDWNSASFVRSRYETAALWTRHTDPVARFCAVTRLKNYCTTFGASGNAQPRTQIHTFQ